MDYRSTYRSFINSHYLSEGLRITLGLCLPAIILGYFHDPAEGITISLGASCVIMVDNAGPIHHRRNAMLLCTAAIFVTALLTGLFTFSAVLLGIFIAILCFVASMLGVYGSRSGSLGLAAMFVMVLNIDRSFHGWQIFYNAIYVLCGGLWYTVLSLSLYGFRPYKLAQQALGDCIQATADYLAGRVAFYQPNPDYDAIYKKLLVQQAALYESQNLVRELLFKSRNITKESTNTGRTLLLIFLDMIDLSERILSTHQDYQGLHQQFDGTGILQSFGKLLQQFADELNETGIAVKSGRPHISSHAADQIKALRQEFEQLRDTERNAENIEGFISLRHILDGIRDIAGRLYTIQQYTTYDLKEKKKAPGVQDLKRFVTHQDIDTKILFNNLNTGSNTFRHAIRVTVATTAGFIVSQFLPVGHSYWILLTIIVILKPAYSLTKKRNYDRLLGTIAGAGIGLGIIYFVHGRDAILACMILLMIAAYSFMRTRYLLFVMFMTPYILILFYLLNADNFNTVITDRVVDTGIGSAIAFLANLFIAPAWEHEQVVGYQLRMLEANKNYFRDTVSFFTGGETGITQFKLSRKQAFVALANLSEAFNRMLAEPRSKQRGVPEMQQFVVLNHMFASHTATLAGFRQTGEPPGPPNDYLPAASAILNRLDASLARLQKQPVATEPVDRGAMRSINDRVLALLDQRKTELAQGIVESPTRGILSSYKYIADQFNFISKIAEDLERWSVSHNQATLETGREEL
jgi:uncharacterized membrane protein (TIGR01666 family)